ncbi:heme o synthase [Gracilibacillus sp. S3-1-1]|uniref:Heme o synthase n=1 Tax=Gracilibacillus pellucidus TaxID=3095368 RepID=A0ACC6M426_9BACI|nr:heme o synthase [Gracilibacillus sp. S3-1-1]MDX8045635.1 heme o synthase [Gracilibacillus sp. S3-1-1]
MLKVLTELKYLFKRFVIIANAAPAVLGFFIALRYHDAYFTDYWLDFILLVVGALMIVGGALTLNNWLEADVDRLMERTKNRPTVTGTIPMPIILLIGIVLSFVGEVLLWLINWEVALYGFIGWFTYVVVYTMWTKRRFTWNTHIGSISGAVTPMMGWAVIDSTFHVIPISIFIIMFLWQMPHTYAIAIRKQEDYTNSGLQMLPVVKGKRVTIRRNAIYIALLLFVPLMVRGYSSLFYILITILNVAWFIIALAGFKATNIKKWANILFASSLAYLLLMYTLYVVFA